MGSSGEREIARALARVQRRIHAAVFVATFGRAAGAALLAVGSVVLLARLLVGALPPVTVCAGTAIVLALLAAALELRRRWLAPAASAAWVDRWSGGAGSIVTWIETGDTRFVEAARAQLAGRELRPRPRVARPLGLALAGGAYLALVFAIPAPAREENPSRGLLESLLADVEQKEAGLTEAVDLPEEDRAELEERLARLREGLASEPPESQYEALDSLEADLERAARRAQSAAEHALSELSEASAGASADLDGARESLERALDALERDGFASAAAAAGARELISKDGLSAGAALDARTVKALARALSSEVRGRLAKLGEAGLLDPSKLASAAPRSFDDFRPTEHECDEPCKTGGG